MSINMMGCFSTSKSERQRSSNSPRSSTTFHVKSSTVVVASKDFSLSLLSNKPAVLPDPSHVLPRSRSEHQSSASVLVTRSRFYHEGLPPQPDVHQPRSGIRRVAFSGPLLSSTAHNRAHNEAIGLLRLHQQQLANVDVAGAGNLAKAVGGAWTHRRAVSFGGRPQPLPRPVTEDDALSKGTKKLEVYNLPLPAPEVVPTSRFAPTSRTRSFKLEGGFKPNGSGDARVTPVGGLPLPPPSLATKLLPSLLAFKFRHLVLATDDFAASCCVSKSASGDVFRARIEDSSGAVTPHGKLDIAVLRLPENAQQSATEWKSEVQLLAQISNPNVCAVKGYSTNEASLRLSPRARRQERLLVFEQPSNSSLYDHLFGGRCTSSLDWPTRVNIALGAARGLLYIHDRAPLQITYREFTASNVLLEKDYAPKLAGYGLSVTVPLVHQRSSFTTSMMLSQSQAKHNVRSFGVLLLELLTGKNSRDTIYFGDDAYFVQWGRQFMKEECRLAHIIDPGMKGVVPVKGVMELVSLSLQCVRKREAQRPSMSEVVETLTTIKAKHCSLTPEVRQSQEPHNFTDTQTSSDASSSGRKPGIRQSQVSHNFTDMQTSSDASSSSENEDAMTSTRSETPHGLIRV